MVRICPACGEHNKIKLNEPLWPAGWMCPKCCNKLINKNEIPILCPELADTIAGFNPDGFSSLFKKEEKYFWFQVRNDLISWLFSRYFPKARSFLEVGCGTGFVISRLVKEKKNIKFTGCEIHPKGMYFAKKRLGYLVDFFQADARNLGLEQCLHVIGAFDVIEHIKEDTLILSNFYKALVPDGGVILTVPQHPFLWSRADELAYHERRYKRGELEQKLKNVGFEILFSSSYTSLLMPAMIYSRLLSHSDKTTTYEINNTEDNTTQHNTTQSLIFHPG